MGIDEQFAQAWLNVEHKVFGFKLKPFSLWHRFLLKVTQSKILDAGSEISAMDVYKAAYVCTLKYPKAPRLGPLSKFRSFVYLLRDVHVNVEKFTAYIQDYVTQPEFWESKDSSGSSTSGPPEELSTVVALMQMGMTEREAWDCPCGMASWYAAAHASWNGANLDFKTEEDRHVMENFDAIMAAAKAKEGKDNGES